MLSKSDSEDDVIKKKLARRGYNDLVRARAKEIISMDPQPKKVGYGGYNYPVVVAYHVLGIGFPVPSVCTTAEGMVH